MMKSRVVINLPVSADPSDYIAAITESMVANWFDPVAIWALAGLLSCIRTPPKWQWYLR